MSERKVLSKYYPPDFDPSAITRQRGPKQTGPKLQQVRLMAPFSMKCTVCSEYIYKGRKFNARKETTDEKYYAIPIYRFYIKCTRCSAEITFKTDPKHMDYTCDKGARRNFEPWRESKLAEETEEERLDRLEREEAERDAMSELETKVLDAKTEMAIADALDEIRTRNARLERADRDGEATVVKDVVNDERKRQDEEDAEYAKNAFAKYQADMDVELEDVDEDSLAGPSGGTDASSSPYGTAQSLPTVSDNQAESTVSTTSWQPSVKKKSKTTIAASLGIKKAQNGTMAPPAPPKTVAAPLKSAPVVKKPLLAGYDDDSD